MEMTRIYWDELTHDLENGATDKGHPFHYFTLGTVGLDHTARLRTVVLRKISSELHLLIFTDDRSKKIVHLKENNKVGLLFYDPHKMLQIRIEGIGAILKDSATKEKYWDTIEPKSKKDYTTTSTPGSIIPNPNAIEYLDSKNHFCAVEIIPFKLEYLKLQNPNHLRVRYSREHNDWEAEFLVP